MTMRGDLTALTARVEVLEGLHAKKPKKEAKKNAPKKSAKK